jgi:hypothetical protein
MNTGEATDTFTFTVLVPGGWTATTQTMTLAAGQEAIARINVTPPATAALGPVIVQASGQSTTDPNIRTVAHFDLLVKRPTVLQYTGVSTTEYSDAANLSVRLTDGLDGQPLSGRQVTFDLGTQHADAETNGDGIATASIVIDQKPGTVDLAIATDWTDSYGMAELTRSFTIDQEDLMLEITSPLLQPLSGSAVIALDADEADASLGDLTLAAVQVDLQPTLTTTPRTGQATLDDVGAAAFTFAGLPSDVWSISVTLVSEYYESAPLTTELVVFDAAAKIGGSAGATDQSGERVKLTAAVSYSSNDATGTLEMQSKPLKFNATDVHWVVVAGSRALVEATGTFNGAPAVLRSDVRDSGFPGGQQDRFSLRITSTAGALLYASGDIVRENGNLVVAGTQ